MGAEHQRVDVRELAGGLAHEVDRARAHGLDRHFVKALAAHHDHGGPVSPEDQFVEDPEAVHVGEPQVQQQDVDAAPIHPGQTGLSRGHHLDRRLAEIPLHAVGCGRFVIRI